MELILPGFTRYSPPATADLHNSQLSALAARWIENCRQNHVNCTPAENHFLPKRLIQIIDEDHWRIVLPRDLCPRDHIEYVALSHCWGGSTQLLKLTGNNERQLQGKMPVKTLPTTFKEAISACSELRFTYLWIDSLCIIQDSVADWQEQAAEMNLVYGNAVLSLCMAGSANPSEASFLSRDTDMILPLSVTLNGHDGKESALQMVCEGMFVGEIRHSPLRQRGWVLQEWYLAKRSLIFRRMQLWWQCCEELACETIPDGISDNFLFKRFKKEIEAMKVKDSNELVDTSHSIFSWQDLIEQYANTALSEETKDRIIAFSGIATVFGKHFNMEDQYVAGLWGCHLPQALLWSRYMESETYRSLEGYKAPSWSWMSLDGPMHLDHASRLHSYCCTVGPILLSPEDGNNRTGQLQGGSIHIFGHLLRLQKGSRGKTIKISLCHFDDNHGHSQVRWDEQNDNGYAVVSYLEIPFSRTRIPLRRANGSFFALPISYEDYGPDEGVGRECSVKGLVLYQPPHQVENFHRVACYSTTHINLAFTLSFADRLSSQHPARSICIL
jgi:hypothetical protein